MEAQVEHMLALKVMRVTRPTLCNFGNTIFTEKQDLLAFDVKNEVIASQQFLQLPQSFGNIYLGETFSSYICVHNCTTHPVNAVSVKCDLQSNSSRVAIPIHANRTIPTSLNHSGETLDDVIHYEVKEIGTHILVCEVSYVSPSGMPLSFRKFFKFQVLKPLDLTTKFYTSENDVILLEATIQNITANTICLERVELEPNDQYSATPLNHTADGRPVSCSIDRLQPQNSCQFIYSLKPMPSIASDLKTLKLATNIGKLDIVWRSSNMAERGRLQTSQLIRNPVEYGDLKLAILEAASICQIAAPFVFKCRITNTSPRTMELQLNFNMGKSRGQGFTGSSEQSLGTLEPEKSHDFKLTVFPTRQGIINISGLVISDVYMIRNYEFGDFMQIFAVNELDETADLQSLVRFHDIPASAALLPTSVSPLVV